MLISFLFQIIVTSKKILDIQSVYTKLFNEEGYVLTINRINDLHKQYIVSYNAKMIAIHDQNQFKGLQKSCFMINIF